MPGPGLMPGWILFLTLVASAYIPFPNWKLHSRSIYSAGGSLVVKSKKCSQRPQGWLPAILSGASQPITHGVRTTCAWHRIRVHLRHHAGTGNFSTPEKGEEMVEDER
eukprot:NP_001295427.1 uncharacterized protein LOC105734734 precursor [Mus musculus]